MSDSVSIREKGSVSTLFSLGFKTVRRPRTRDSEEWTLSGEDQPKRRKCVQVSSYPSDRLLKTKNLDEPRNLYQPDHRMEPFSLAKDCREEAREVPESFYKTPEKQMITSRIETIPPTPRKQFHSEIPNFLKDRPGPPSRVGACACCGRVTKLRNSMPICLRLDCALHHAQID
ncbi:hypothetical protein Gasu2_50930 [Galdieria sulphuraria]|uniref:Uncharacterized protein n=1 Tax=Galdieria sulphuraria TaxID=130081 RepID=M2Y4V0_GALSU|nr:uncharacterized protein Gasu_17600 [Galdieria sulphuraria]EME30998.1 hypothetical protein Gasu_17600 [Galdieria sulphuraria]GJD10930.1 hypothetical protein Gasu2_50930 [Galdieria sulphuraria]|eukprot:XP_005707518.1 hypothetical protein Gasu_17600 [Galdieria sulphuraria]